MKKTRRRRHIIAVVSLFVSILFWAAVPLFLRSFIHDIDAWTANGFRYPFSALLLLLPLGIFHRRGEVKPWMYRSAVVPSLINLCGQTLWAWAPYYLEPAMLMFLTRASIVFAIIFSFLIFPDERPLIHSIIFWFGLFLSVSGFVGMNWLSGKPLSGGSLTGLLLVLGNGIFLGLYGVSVRYSMRGAQPWISFPIICLYTSLGVLPIMFLFGEPSRLGLLPFSEWGMLALSSVIGIGLAHVFFYYAIEYLGVSITNGCHLTGPFLTAVGSYIIFGEVFTLGQWLSGILILAGAFWLLKAQLQLRRNMTT